MEGTDAQSPLPCAERICMNGRWKSVSSRAVLPNHSLVVISSFSTRQQVPPCCTTALLSQRGLWFLWQAVSRAQHPSAESCEILHTNHIFLCVRPF